MTSSIMAGSKTYILRFAFFLDYINWNHLGL